MTRIGTDLPEGVGMRITTRCLLCRGSGLMSQYSAVYLGWRMAPCRSCEGVGHWTKDYGPLASPRAATERREPAEPA